jgi:hypothetical protein
MVPMAGVTRYERFLRGSNSTHLPNQTRLQPPHHRQRLNRRQELPVGLLLPAEDQVRHFRRESIDLV